MALKRGWKSVGRRQKRRCWLRLAPPFFGVVGRCGKGAILSWFQIWEFIWIFSLGIHLWKFGNSKSGNGGVDGKGVKVRIFSVWPPILGNSPPLNGTHLFEIHIIIYSVKPDKQGDSGGFTGHGGRGTPQEGGAGGGTRGGRVYKTIFYNLRH